MTCPLEIHRPLQSNTGDEQMDDVILASCVVFVGFTDPTLQKNWGPCLAALIL